MKRLLKLLPPSVIRWEMGRIGVVHTEITIWFNRIYFIPLVTRRGFIIEYKKPIKVTHL